MSRREKRYGKKALKRLLVQQRRQAQRLALKAIKLRQGENRHHLQPRSRGGDFILDEKGRCNISVVRIVDHEHWHALFSNLMPQTICELINQKWLDRRFKFICVPNE
jgi:hypothetical protein